MFQNKRSNFCYLVVAFLLFSCIVLSNGCCWKGCERKMAEAWYDAFTFTEEEYSTYVMIQKDLDENVVAIGEYTMDQIATHEMVRMNLGCN